MKKSYRDVYQRRVDVPRERWYDTRPGKMQMSYSGLGAWIAEFLRGVAAEIKHTGAKLVCDVAIDVAGNRIRVSVIVELPRKEENRDQPTETKP